MYVVNILTLYNTQMRTNGMRIEKDEYKWCDKSMLFD